MASVANLPTMLADADYSVPDPGNGATITAGDKWQHIKFTTGASGETNTLATPTTDGVLLVLMMKSHGGGDRVVTVASGNVSGANTDDITFNANGDTVILYSVPNYSGGYRWMLINFDGSIGFS